MKYLSRILFAMGLVFGLSACTEDAYETTVPELPAKGEMSVNLTFALPDAEAQTRSKVSGTEKRVHTMQMVCFDAKGLYLGIRNAEISPYDVDNTKRIPDAGTIKGTVPQGTSHIHFIANRNLSIPLNASVGTPEAQVMASEELSTLWNEKTIGTGDDAHQEVCYWGYHKEDNATKMEAWLNPSQQQGQSKVYMIRDRAQIVLEYNPAGASVPVKKIEWLIHNGRERGYLAPAETSWGNESYYENSSVASAGYISKAGMNEYTKDDNRYSIENDSLKFDKTYDVTEGTTVEEHNLKVPQFLFDDDNTDEENARVKAILRVTYTVDGKDKVVYHVLRLNDDNRVLYDVVRNHTYYIKASLLTPDVAYYTSLKAAIDGKDFMNADIEVSREITDINDATNTLQILLPTTQTTSIVFNTAEKHYMDFAFRLVSDVSETASTDPKDFEIFWEKSAPPFSSQNDLNCTYVESSKQFRIEANITSVTDQLQDHWLVVKHKDGLTRYIHVYVINQFKFLKYPTLKKVGNTSNYVLSFQIPPTKVDDPQNPMYPSGLYPINVNFTTNTLNAYNDKQTGTNYGLFSVEIDDTDILTNKSNFEAGDSSANPPRPAYNSPISSTSTSDINRWYFQQLNNWWDFWYTYSIKNYEQTVAEDGTTGGGGYVNIYLQDVTDHIKYATVNEVGLFMQIDYFGKIYSIPVTQ